MRSSYLTRAGAALLLVAAVLAVSACGCSRVATSGTGSARQSQLASGTADASSSVGATSGTTSQDASGSGSPGDGSGSGNSSKPAKRTLSESDARAIDAELSAIEKELDSMALPSDSDFGGIESGLE